MHLSGMQTRITVQEYFSKDKFSAAKVSIVSEQLFNLRKDFWSFLGD